MAQGLGHTSPAVRAASYSLLSVAASSFPGISSSPQWLVQAVRRVNIGGDDGIPAVRAAAAKAACQLASILDSEAEGDLLGSNLVIFNVVRPE
jgi:hypothetical protein